MASSATLASLTTRVKEFLVDAGAAVFPATLITEGITQAVEEFNRARPQQDVSEIVVPIPASRELSLAALTGCSDVLAVWFPYVSANYPPGECSYREYLVAGDRKIYLDGEHEPLSGEKARVFYRKPHTLN